jgi:ABC-2 type transport system ATP-binding protein
VRVLGLDPIADATALRPRVGVMLQGGVGGYTSAKAMELLRLFASYAAHPHDPAALLDSVGLADVAQTQVKRLSGGQQQRLSLALALVGRPELVFLDEPTAGMDPQARRGTWEFIRRLRADGVSVVLTTHFLDEAEHLADTVVVIDAGRVVAAGTPAELTRSGAEGQIRFRATPGLLLASLVAALPAGSQATEPEPGRYLVSGEVSPQLLAMLTAWCAGQGVLADDLTIGRRSLEDVFLELTGRGLRT